MNHFLYIDCDLLNISWRDPYEKSIQDFYSVVCLITIDMVYVVILWDFSFDFLPNISMH